MTIFNHGLHFTCFCGISAEANVSTDFHCILCNGTKNYYIVCLNCGNKIEVKEDQIPYNIRKHITVETALRHA